MRYVKASARKLQVLVGDDSQDWSECLELFQCGWSQRDDSGIIFTRGKLRLGSTRLPPGTMNTRSALGRQRWFKGQKIIINCTDENGGLNRHPVGFLYILKPPAPWSVGKQYLEIEVGCELSLRNFRQPDEILLQAPQAAVDRDAAIAKALRLAGVKGQYIGNISAYPVPFMITKEGTSNVELGGKLAYGGKKFLVQNNQGQIDAVDASMLLGNPLLTLHIGEGDEISYDPIDGGEFPSEKIKFTGVQGIYKYRKQGEVSTSIEYGPASMIDWELGDEEIAIRITTRTEGVDESGAVGRFSSERVEAPLGLVAPEAFPSSTEIGLDTETGTRYFYDSSNRNRLSQIEVVENRLFPAACPEQWAAMGEEDQERFLRFKVTSKHTITYYQYSGDDVVKAITIYLSEPKGAIAKDEELLDPGTTILSELKTTNYHKIFEEEWRRSESLRQSGAKIKADIGDLIEDAEARARLKMALMSKSNTVEVSNAGQCQPPATDRKPKQWTVEDKPINATATFSDYANPHEPRERTFNLDVGCAGPAQLSELAQLEGVILLGRALGQEIQIAFRDEFFTTPHPLPQINCYEPEFAPQGIRKNLVSFQADGIQFTHDSERGIIGLSGIWLATQEGDWHSHNAAVITPPEYSIAQMLPPYRSVILEKSGNTVTGIIEPELITRSGVFRLGVGFRAEMGPYSAPSILQGTYKLGLRMTSELLAPTSVGGGGGGGNESFEPETNTLLAVFTGDYDAARQEAINACIAAWKASGVWDTQDVIGVFAAPNEHDACINWKNPSQTFTRVKSWLDQFPEFTIDQGFRGGSDERHINTGFDPATAGGNYGLNSATIGYYSRTNDSSPGVDMLCEWDVFFRVRSNDTHSFFNINESNNYWDYPVSSGLGWFSATRDGSAVRAYRNTTEIGANTVAPVSVPNNTFKVLPATSGEYSNGDRQCAAFAIGGSLTAQQNSDFYTPLQGYLTTIGAAV